jgi:predicted TIM-barrel enzyme
VDAVVSTDEALLALAAEADGVYLIDHRSRTTDMLYTVFNNVSEKAPGAFIGLNLLQTNSSYAAFEEIGEAGGKGRLNRLPDGLWVDDASYFARETQTLREQNQAFRDITYLGGVAFKYTQKYTNDPEKAAEQARQFAPLVDVVTTTGRATGQSASIAKVTSMKQAIAPQRMAIASGVSIENIQAFAEVADQALVASSVETHPQSGVLDQRKLRRLIRAAHR